MDISLAFPDELWKIILGYSFDHFGEILIDIHENHQWYHDEGYCVPEKCMLCREQMLRDDHQLSLQTSYLDLLVSI